MNKFFLATLGTMLALTTHDSHGMQGEQQTHVYKIDITTSDATINFGTNGMSMGGHIKNMTMSHCFFNGPITIQFPQKYTFIIVGPQYEQDLAIVVDKTSEGHYTVSIKNDASGLNETHPIDITYNPVSDQKISPAEELELVALALAYRAKITQITQAKK